MFSHAIIIDFEATCYDKLEKPPDGWRAEIVEFPAVLLDLKSGEIGKGFWKSFFFEIFIEYSPIITLPKCRL